MRWIIKATIQKIIGRLPYSTNLNYLLQKKISKTLPLSLDKFLEITASAFKHWSTFRLYNHTPLSDLSLFEFGAGWDLTIPLTYSALGIKHQTLIDIKPLVKNEFINDTINKFKQHRRLIEKKLQLKLSDQFYQIINQLNPFIINSLNKLGIRYIAPLDARTTQLPANSFDLISNTNTLEHIPADNILDILQECYRLLKPKGYLSVLIDLKDHYAYFDHNISTYNFLKFSDAIWNILFNNPLHYQNRYRIGDYLNLASQTKFKVITLEKKEFSSLDRQFLKYLKLNRKFKTADLSDIGVKDLYFLLQKPTKF